jgi:cell division transport system ATP-binding protein
MIAFQGISKIYNHNSIALDGVRFKINPHEFVSVVGRSGAGKSTIIKRLIGEERPTKGRVIFESLEVNKLRDEELLRLRRHIGIIFQDFRLLPQKTAFDTVAFAVEVAGRSQAEINDLVPQAWAMVGVKDKMYNFPRELSGGEKQRVAIARAMINQPEVLVADEPTGNLDPVNTWEVIKLLIKINELGSTVILATHDKEIVNTLGRRVISLDNGKLVRDDEHGNFIL